MIAAETGIVEVEAGASVGPIAADWDRLADRTGAAPFLRPGWTEAWNDAFGRGRLELVTARRDGRLVGLLPVQRRRSIVLSPTNWHTPLFGVLAEDDQARADLAGRLFDGGGSRIDLSMLDAADPALEALHATASRVRYRVVRRTITQPPYLPLEGSFEDYRAQLSRGLRREVGRHLRRLGEHGAVEFAFERGAERLDTLLDEGFAIEGSGWKARSGTAIVSRPETDRFYRGVARWAAARGALVLAFLRLEGRPLAFDMCIEEGGVCYVLKGGFDADFRRFAPGTLLTHASIERAYAEGLASYELLGTADSYKLAWTRAVHERVRFQAFSPSPAGQISRLAWTRGRALAKRVLAAAGRG
jgi:CelD/BcsL family acetyltransferase involved in cellulose biosynthesis